MICPKVSVLVPCYNVEKYLPECLGSIVNQTLRDIEIICINDGSTDSTLDIIKSYAEQDKRIVIIDKPNEGYGKSMNRGLDAATGEYIAIVESDDWASPDMLEKLYNTACAHQADMVKAEFVFFDNDTGTESASWGIGLNENLHNSVLTPRDDAPHIIWSGHPSIWTCLYSHKMLNDKNIRFAETPGASFQDMGFKPKSLISSERFVYIPDVVLHYRKHANNSDKNNSKIFAVCDVHDDADAWFAANFGNNLKIKKILNMCRFANYIWNLRRLSGDARKQFKKRFVSDMRAQMKSKEIEYNYMDSRQRVKLKHLCMNSRFAVLSYIMHMGLLLIYKTRIHNGHTVSYLFHKFPVSKRQGF